MKQKTLLKWAVFFFLAFFFVSINLNDPDVIENDRLVSSYVIENQVSWVHNISSFLGVLFEPVYIIFFIFLLGSILFALKYREESFYFIFVSLTSGALIYLLKLFLARERPFIQFLAETGHSFPSGHAAISVIFFGSLIFFSSKIHNTLLRTTTIFLSCLGIVILGLSRVYLNVHWFSDILGGYFLGTTILLVGIIFYKSNIFQKLTNLFHPK